MVKVPIKEGSNKARASAYVAKHLSTIETALATCVARTVALEPDLPLPELVRQLEAYTVETKAYAEAEKVRGVLAEDTRSMIQTRLGDLGPRGLRELFAKFDVNGDGKLVRSELAPMLHSLFDSGLNERDSSGASAIDRLVDAFDADSDGEIDLQEFEASWRCWFGAALSPVRALVIIDVQNDFIDGSLSLRDCPAGQDASEVVPVINAMREAVPFDVVAVSLDWHPESHCSFHDTVTAGDSPSPLHPTQDAAEAKSAAPFGTVTLTAPDGHSTMPQILWPRHCVQNTWGSECHKDLRTAPSDVLVYKGTHPGVDSYSAFYDNSKYNQTNLLTELRSRGVTHVYVCGLALDVCVAFSALHAAEEGFVTTVVEDACRGVSEEGIAEKKALLQRGGVQFARSETLPHLFSRSSLQESLVAAKRVNQAKELVHLVNMQSGHAGKPSVAKQQGDSVLCERSLAAEAEAASVAI